MDAKKTTVILGLAFIFLLVISYGANVLFFSILGDVLTPRALANQFLALAMLFTNNVLVISLILLGMTFYVNLVILDFFKREKYAGIVLEHPRTFAIAFTIMILFLSILRGSTLIYGGISIQVLPIIILVSVPVGIVEGYGIYLTIKKTLIREMTMKSLASIYVIFLIAAIMEVGFINLLIWVSVR